MTSSSGMELRASMKVCALGLDRKRVGRRQTEGDLGPDVLRVRGGALVEDDFVRGGDRLWTRESLSLDMNVGVLERTYEDDGYG